MTPTVSFPVGMGVAEETVMSMPSICVWKSLQVACRFIFVLADGKACASGCDDLKQNNRQSNSMWLFLLLKETVALFSVSSYENPPGVENNSEQRCNLQT